MYWNGARLDGTYPLSIVTDGMAMNITLVTNNEAWTSASSPAAAPRPTHSG
jgi:hypothetical protein